jgi:hypothetical protein
MFKTMAQKFDTEEKIKMFKTRAQKFDTKESKETKELQITIDPNMTYAELSNLSNEQIKVLASNIINRISKEKIEGLKSFSKVEAAIVREDTLRDHLKACNLIHKKPEVSLYSALEQSFVFSFLAVCFIVWSLFGEIEHKVAEDSAKQYAIVEREGDPMEVYIQAGLTAAAYLQAKDEVNYKKWKQIEKNAYNRVF